LHDFRLADGTRLTTPFVGWEDAGPALDDRKATLARLRPGEEFVYVFDFGDDWAHFCAVGEERIDPLDEVGLLVTLPMRAVLIGDVAPAPVRSGRPGPGGGRKSG
jgi:hypothetical protein